MTIKVPIPAYVLTDRSTDLKEECYMWFEHHSYEMGHAYPKAKRMSEHDYLLRIYMTSKKCTYFLTLIQNKN